MTYIHDHFTRIYRKRAADYQRMIAAEDVEGNLLPALKRVAPLRGSRLLDLGTGTGRLPRLICQQTASIVGIDLHTGMLRENQRQRALVGGHWMAVQADMRALPLRDNWADVVTAGWAIGHLLAWYAPTWQAHIERVLSEMKRVARPGAALVIIETLGTGRLTPAPPTPELAEYYRWLEASSGFARQIIRTDYQFASVAEAVALTEFFFGSELASTIRDQGWLRVPEWTGVWNCQNEENGR